MAYQGKSFGSVNVHIYTSRDEMGKAAAGHVVGLIRQVLKEQQTANMVFAAAPSQNEFLSYLTKSSEVDWSRVVGFHMDEYIGLPASSDQFFSLYLQNHLFTKVRMKHVHILDSQAVDPVQECERYAALLRENPTDIVCMGIGENGHIAFNDPPVADFDDKYLVKIVELDEPCRQQQVHDGCFPSLQDVPPRALTLTVPALMSAKYLSVVAPSDRKAKAVRESLLGPVTTNVPASVLRRHDRVSLFIDEHAASLLLL